MKTLLLIALVVLAPIVLFLGWFRRKTFGWMAVWFVIGGAICASLLVQALRAPDMDWGYTMGLFWLWLAFFVLGGVVQTVRIFTNNSAD